MNFTSYFTYITYLFYFFSSVKYYVETRKPDPIKRQFILNS